MRVAYVGLSSPIMYDYKNQGEPASSDLTSSPNPILDTSFGLLLMYDQVWFLCRSLCPQNMRNLPYVKFLDETEILPQLKDVKEKVAETAERFHEDPVFVKKNDQLLSSFRDYNRQRKKLGIYWDAAPDNHSHELRIKDITLNANSIHPEKILFDLEIIRKINRDNVEFVTNTFTQRWFDDPENPIWEAKLAEILVIDNIPNYLTPKGPYHECIEDARNNQYLIDFRKWVSSQQSGMNDKQIKAIKREVENQIGEFQDKIFLKYLDQKTLYWGIGKTLLAGACDLAVPGIGTGVDMIQEVKKYLDSKKRRWQGFIVSSRGFGKRC